jgi:hypothetical protein
LICSIAIAGRVGVEVGKYLIFRNPASVNFVSKNELSGLIVDL